MVSLRRYSYRLLVCFVWSGVLAGCNNAGSNEASNPYVADFEVLWHTFDAQYSYFVFKNIDWQARYDTIRPRLDQVTTDEDLLAVFQDLLAPLRDKHVYFRRPDGSTIPTYMPSQHINWDRDVWLAFVQGQGWQQVAPNLGYARIDSLSYIAIGAWNTNQFSAEDFDAVLDQVRESPGLILDVRMNGGGNDQLALQVAGRFTDEDRVVEYVQFRDGPNHDDFTDLTPRTLTPRGPWTFDKPVALLVGRRVLSSNETFVAAMREIPHVTVLGDTTGASSGNPAFFELSNGLEFSVPRWIAYTADQTVIEWNGIPPDIAVPTTDADFAQGRDPVLDGAVAWLRERLSQPEP